MIIKILISIKNSIWAEIIRFNKYFTIKSEKLKIQKIYF